MNRLPGKGMDVFATAACCGMVLFWSSGPIFIKYLTGYLDFWTQNLLRYTVACVFWLPILGFIIWRGKLPVVVWKRAIVPACANVLMQSFFAATYYYLDPAFMNLLLKLSVIWIAGFSIVFFGAERPLVRSKRFWLGTLMSFAGVSGVLIFKEDFSRGATLTGIILALVTSVLWAVYTLSVKICMKQTDARMSFSVISIYSVAGFIILAVVFGDVGQCLQMPAWPWACVVISGITSIAFTHVLYYAAMKRIGATIPSLTMLATPFVVFGLSYMVFGETLNIKQLVFGIVLLGGAGFSIWAQQHLKRN